MTEPILRYENFSVRFSTPEGEVKAVNQLNLDLMPGEILAIVGESGSGKSQTILGLLGLLAKNGSSEGKAVFQGKDLTGLSQQKLDQVRGSEIGIVFQDALTALNPVLTIGIQLSEVLEVHFGKSRAEARAEVVEMLTKVGIPEAERRLKQYPHELSGGMRQRVMIAMALLCKPKLLIADEPTTALDVTTQAQILDLFRDLCAELSTALILITHDMGVVAGIAERVAVMYGGKIVELAEVDTIFSAPRHPYTSALLSSLPARSKNQDEILTIPGNPPNPAALPSGCSFHPRCQFASAHCTKDAPELQRLDSGGALACHFPLPRGDEQAQVQAP